MVTTGALVHIERVEALEKEMSGLKAVVGQLLRIARESAGLSLWDVAPDVGLTAMALSNIERGKSWRTKTVREYAEVLESVRAA